MTQHFDANLNGSSVGIDRKDDCLQGHKRGVWVFGYGSLMWRPNFHYDFKVQGRCVGVQRSFCVYSVYHRGSYKQPGLVLGLRGGGVCDGVLYHVPANRVRDALSNLRKREQVTLVYREAFRRVEFADGSKRQASALCYLADEGHAQYARQLSVGKKAAIIKRARGQSGTNIDYLTKTLSHLDKLGIADEELRRILVLSGRSVHLR